MEDKNNKTQSANSLEEYDAIMTSFVDNLKKEIIDMSMDEIILMSATNKISLRKFQEIYDILIKERLKRMKETDKPIEIIEEKSETIEEKKTRELEEIQKGLDSI